ncbi:G1 family glutamic endopeptidase [Nonomuraea lactucae]|uniref:G1 family glutamic endopeptidase n=1 Tax=Nonomuraea lactucae TaxID=2249762 RepID=UPI000DE436F8|nr:G1 family glutamic endopeptidase [Nonomuraea lactucae]
MPARLRLRVSTTVARTVAKTVAIPAILLLLAAAASPARAATAQAAPWHYPWAGIVYHEIRVPGQERPWETIYGAEADVTIPCVSDRTPTGVYYAWVGLGGFTGGRIIRAGLAARKQSDGTVSYWTWVENRFPRSWRLNPPSAAVPPAPEPEDIAMADDDLCGKEINVGVWANGRVVIGSPSSPMDRRVGPMISHGLAPTAQFIVQAVPWSRHQGTNTFRGTFTFTRAHLEARRDTGRTGIGWPGRPETGGSECTEENGRATCQVLQPRDTRVEPILDRPATFRVRVR